MSKQKINRFVGSIGAFIGILVFIAYIPQIIANLQGEKAQDAKIKGKRRRFSSVGRATHS